MRILIHGINYSPELTGIGKYSGELAEWLASRGHEVRVVTAPPYYPEWRVGAGYGGNPYRRELREGVEVWRCPLWVPSRPTGARRLLHLASFALSSLPVMLRQAFWRPDVVWVVEPAFFCAPGAWLTAQLSGARAWLHVQDFEMDAAFDLGLIKAPWLKRLVLGAERWLMGRFDRISTISPGMLNRLSEKGVSARKVVSFPNWVDVGSIAPQEQDSRHEVQAGYRAELGISQGAIVALYSGNIGEKQGLELVVEAARLLESGARGKADIQFVLCGDGATKPKLVTMAEGLTNVHWLPLQPLERLNELLNAADIHLLPQRASAADLVMPSKLTGIFASGRPVVATAEPGTTVYEAVSGRGVVVPPENAELFTAAILELARDAEKRSSLGMAARRYAEENLDKTVILARFEKALLELQGASLGDALSSRG